MNGVYLPGCKSSMSGSIHCGQHTKAYAKLVYDGLKNAEKNGGRVYFNPLLSAIFWPTRPGGVGRFRFLPARAGGCLQAVWCIRAVGVRPCVISRTGHKSRRGCATCRLRPCRSRTRSGRARGCPHSRR
ncbi:AHH domain-containing protein [Eikenella halliae]|uniref:AHH domain-containing protein n=1 Tax=Eikenella halliae TaxID=1795832 RepID=UPI0009ECF9FF